MKIFEKGLEESPPYKFVKTRATFRATRANFNILHQNINKLKKCE